MLKISVIDSRTQRSVVIEGTLIEPWQAAKTDLQGRKLVLDLKNVTRIDDEGERALSELVQEGASFSSCGVLTKYLLQQLARRNKQSARAASIMTPPGTDREKK